MISSVQLQRWLGPLPGQREARAFAWISLTVAVIICTISVLRGFHGQTFMGRPLGGDFVQFYVAGKILNQFEPARLYDMDLEVRLQHEAVPEMSASQMLVFASAPAVALIYRPFALLPYRWGYVAWLVFSISLYAAALVLVIRSVPLSNEHRRTGFLLGLSAVPFLLETWIGGQISVLAVSTLALFVFFRSRNSSFLAGAALALALFKPTLVAIPILMLLVGRCWRMLGGVVAAAMALGLVSFLTVGTAGCIAWIRTLQFYGGIASGTGSALHRNKYVDLGSFFHLILGDPSLVAQILALIGALGGLATLGYAWWRSGKWSSAAQSLLWSATLAAALVVNVYTPIYDTTLVVIPVALCAPVVFGKSQVVQDGFTAWLLLVIMVPWLTQAVAEFLRFQPFTLVLAGFAGWALRQAWRQTGSDSGVQHTDSVEDRTSTLAAPEVSAYAGALGSSAVAESSRTNNSVRRLSVSLRFYSSLPTLIWERDR